MQFNAFDRLGPPGGWVREAAAALLLLGAGFGLMPLAIFAAGSASLGRYDNASAGRVYEAVYHGLGSGSAASWIVVLGPYGLYLAFRALQAWWRASARLA